MQQQGNFEIYLFLPKLLWMDHLISRSWNDANKLYLAKLCLEQAFEMNIWTLHYISFHKWMIDSVHYFQENNNRITVNAILV